jgi:hypothetical protein
MAGNHTSVTVSGLWVGGWLFTIGYAHPHFWQIVLALLIWGTTSATRWPLVDAPSTRPTSPSDRRTGTAEAVGTLLVRRARSACVSEWRNRQTR